jgi:hypothetical protein
MRIHSDVLTPSRLVEAIDAAGLDIAVHLDSCSVHKSRKRARGIEFRLGATERVGTLKGERITRRPRNTGKYGAEQAGGHLYAATYDEHGEWMARLFDADPDAIIGYYDGRDHFHAETRYQYGG